MIYIARTYRISQLIIDNERELKRIEHAENIESITTPEGRELTPEELFDFVIGSKITDLARTKSEEGNASDIAIVLGNIALPTTRERAIKAFELYKLGLVKRIIFTGGITKLRDKKGFIHHSSLEEYMNNELVEGLEWEDLPEADWGSETFIKEVFDENYQEHSLKLTEKFLNDVGIKPEDILTEAMSTTTQENAEFCKNIFDVEEVETGEKVRTAILVTTCTHGSRATKQFEKVFGDKIKFKWCPSTLDLEQYDSLKAILMAPNFDEEAFRKELKRIYCTNPQLIQMLKEEVGHIRNVFIKGEIDEPVIKTTEKGIRTELDDSSR